MTANGPHCPGCWPMADDTNGVIDSEQLGSEAALARTGLALVPALVRR